MKINKPTTTSLTISHIDYSPSGDVVMMYCRHSDMHWNEVEESSNSVSFIGIQDDKIWFQAGQFMLLTATIEDKVIKRSYSIATTPQLLSEQWLIGFSIKRVEDGVFSTRATQLAKSWNTLTMTWPLWHMTDDEVCDDYLLISAGSWLSPVYAIYHSLLHSSRPVRIANIFGERYFSHILPDVHHDRVTSASLVPSLHSGWLASPHIYSQCFLSQDEHKWYCCGRVQLWLSNALDRLATTQIKVFICWAPEMVDDVRLRLVDEYWIDPTSIKFEKY